MAEYVCGDGRMSVNGICPASSYPGYQEPAENIVTPPVINTNQNVSGGMVKIILQKITLKMLNLISMGL